MSRDDEADQTVYRVVMNHEEQYSIWPVDKDIPAGWSDAGRQGPRADCLAYIDEVWTDMRPKSLRDAMARQGS
jgi:MbtH protein